MNETLKLKNRNERIVKDFLTKPLTLEQLGNENNLTKESIRLILTEKLTHLEYKKRKAEIVSFRRAERLKKEGVKKACLFCNKKMVYLYEYIPKKFCSKSCFYNYKKSLLSPEEREARKKIKAKEYYAKYWQKKKKRTK